VTVKTNGIARIETVGAVVRGPHGQLCRITEVVESSRMSERHVSAPLDVVVRTEPVGSPGYGHSSAWASSLSLALPTDRFGAHGHREGCACGMPYDPTIQGHIGWYHMRESWA
jgi:hypothetical protein